MGYIGGGLHRAFVERIRGVEPERLLAVPIDVGKHTAAALVCDFWGEVVVAPFMFSLDERGFEMFARAVASAGAERGASWTRVGLEQAGHYHQVLLARLIDHGLDVVLLNPAQVRANRAQDLLRSLKSDVRDLGAMAELLIRGKGHPAGTVDEATWCSRACRGASARSSTPSSAACSSPRGWTPSASGVSDRSA